MHGRENQYGHYQIHQPFCEEHIGLPEIHPSVKGQEYPRVFREREYQYYEFQRGGAADHHGIAGAAGKPVLKPECEAWSAVPLPAGACAGQP